MHNAGSVGPPPPPYGPPPPPYGPPPPPLGPPYGPGIPFPPPAPRRRRGIGIAIAAGATVLVLWAAAGYAVVTSVTGADGGGDGPGPGPSASAPPVAPGCEPFAAYQGLDGTTVTVLVGGSDALVVDPYAEASQPFTDCTGIAVEYDQVPLGDFTPHLQTRIAANESPDLAVISTPDQLQPLAADGALAPATPAVDEAVTAGWPAAYADLGIVDGVRYGVPLGITLHSLVWYSPAYFAETGYEVPQTWDDMIALSDAIAAGGGKPWCDGWADLAWPGAIWVAEAMLRLHGPEVYGQWLRHEFPFDDPRVVGALDLVGEILKDPDYVNGGFGDVASIADVPFTQAGQPVLTGECTMYRQADFYAGLWPNGTELGESGEVWVFPLPPLASGTGAPAVANGEFAVALSNRPEVAAVHAYLASAEWASTRIALGDFATGHQDVDPADAVDPIDRATMELLQTPGVEPYFVPDGLLPPEVNNAFWDELTEWILGQDSQATAANVESAWP